MIVRHGVRNPITKIDNILEEIQEGKIVRMKVHFDDGEKGFFEDLSLMLEYVELFGKSCFFRGTIVTPHFLSFSTKNASQRRKMEGFVNFGNPKEIRGWVSFEIHKSQEELNPSP